MQILRFESLVFLPLSRLDLTVAIEKRRELRFDGSDYNPSTRHIAKGVPNGKF